MRPRRAPLPTRESAIRTPRGAIRLARTIAGSAARCAALALIALAALSAPGTGTAWAHGAHQERVSIRSPARQPQLADQDSLATADGMPIADHVIVRKSERRLYLMRGNTVLRSYKIALGLNPIGQKERSGDFRTPEGRYYLTRRNPRSDYFLSIQVSYPNATDLRRARVHRWDAGGAIMIHGLPNHLRRPPQYYEKYDWTDGCIAVSDSDMLEIWLMTRENTPIDILP